MSGDSFFCGNPSVGFNVQASISKTVTMEDYDFKYTEEGQQVVVLEKISDNVHRIQFTYEREDDEPYFGKAQLWDKPLFDSPPMPKMHELAEKMEKGIAVQIEQRKSLTDEIKALKDRKTALETELSTIPGLQNIVDFLKSPPTHFICERYHYPYIVSVDRCKVDYSHLANIGIKTGYGLREPEVLWWVKTKKENSYDYNDQETGIPCNGIDDARAKLKVALKKWYDSNKGYRHTPHTINMLKENGVDVPDTYIADMIASLNAEHNKIGLDVEAQKAKKRVEIDEWQSLLSTDTAKQG